MISTITNIITNNIKYINLIPSENILLKWAISAYNSVFFNRYYFPPINWVYVFPGRDYLKEIENYTIELIRKKINQEFIDISTNSWVNCMQTVLFSFVKQWDVVFTISVKDWWHFITDQIIEKIWWHVLHIPFIKNKLEIDYEKFSDEIRKNNKTSLIYIDQMTWIYPISLKKLDEYIDTSKIVKYYDVSHNFAFIISWLHKNPIHDWYTAFWGSTHKTIPWPHKWIFITWDYHLFNIYLKNIQVTVSHKHYSDIYALWMIFEEMDTKWEIYTRNIIKNVNTFALQLDKTIYCILNNNKIFSKNHQLLIYSKDNNLLNIFQKLIEIWILVNYLPLPFTWKMWLRLWFQEITILWASKDTIKELAYIFNSVLIEDSEILKQKIKVLNSHLNYDI